MCFLFNRRWILWTFVFLVLLEKIHSKFEFTNLKCESVDKEFCDFEYCYLKSINRTYKYMSLKVNLYKVPINQFSIRMEVLKRTNGYQTMIPELTLDGCKLMKNINVNPMSAYLYGFFKPYSNINHSCPFDHNLLIEKIPIDLVNYRLTKIIPFPEGHYVLNTSWFAYGVRRAVVQVYGTLS